MECPNCGKEMEFGGVKVMDNKIISSSNVVWYPQEELDKFYKRDYVELELKADGFYCDECMKVVAVFNQR